MRSSTVVGYYRMYACAYNIDQLCNTRQIDPPGMVRIVYYMRALYIHGKQTCSSTETLLLSV